MAEGQDRQIIAQAEPSTLMVGDSGSYHYRFLNFEGIPSVTTPRVEGLAFSSNPSQSNFTQIVNGRMTAERRLTWRFQATREGTFTIPGRTVTIDRQTFTIDPVTVRVVPMSEERKSRHFLRLSVPEGPFYVGQSIPAQLILAIREDLGISQIALPQRIGDAYTNSEIGNEPARARGSLDGQRYQTFTWNVVLTPIKAGEHPLQFNMNLAVRIPNRQRDPFPSMFGFSRESEEAVTLSTDPLNWIILPVPFEGRPEGFTDAVGSFSVSAELEEDSVAVGEPVTFTISVSGSGNFDRIRAPEIPENPDWRVYPPKVEFVPANETGTEGTKSFQYILIPQSIALVETPAIAFSSFNPESAEFTDQTIQSIPLEVTPSELPELSGTLPRLTQENPDAPPTLRPAFAVPGHLFLPNHSNWFTASVWVLNGLFCVIFSSIWFRLILASKHAKDPTLARKTKLSKDASTRLAAARQSAKLSNPEEFFKEATMAVRAQVACLPQAPRNCDPRSLVMEDILELLQISGADETTLQSVSTLFEKADALQFAGIQLDSTRLAELEGQLESTVKSISRLKS